MAAFKHQLKIDLMKLRRLPAFPTSNVNSNTDETKIEEESLAAVQKQQVIHKKKLEGLVVKTEKVLMNMRNIIPIFTSEIVIDTAKVTIIHRPFFFSETIDSVPIKNITDVSIQTVPFLATMHIIQQNFPNSNYEIRWIWKKKAERARTILAGLMQANKEGIDLKSLEDDDLAGKLIEIGRIRETVTSVSEA